LIVENGERATQAMAAMSELRARLGDLWPDRDAVGFDQYDEVKAALRGLKEETVMKYSRNAEEQAKWRCMWPFDD
jgi:hypothetical protein